MIHNLDYYSRRHGSGKDIVHKKTISDKHKAGMPWHPDCVPPSGLPTTSVVREIEASTAKPMGKDYLWVVIRPQDVRQLKRHFVIGWGHRITTGQFEGLLAIPVKASTPSELAKFDWIIQVWHNGPFLTKQRQMS